MLAAFLVLFAWPQSASAHDSLVESDPAADSTVETLPDQLTLTFSAALIGGDGASEVVVLDPEGNNVAEGAPELDGAMLTQKLGSGTVGGLYNVQWKVVSSDGHPTSDEFDFTVSTGSTGDAEVTAAPSDETTAAPDEASPPASAVPATEDDTNMSSESSVAVPWVIGGAVVVLVAAFLVFLATRNRRSTTPRADSDDSAEG